MLLGSCSFFFPPQFPSVLHYFIVRNVNFKKQLKISRFFSVKDKASLRLTGTAPVYVTLNNFSATVSVKVFCQIHRNQNLSPQLAQTFVQFPNSFLYAYSGRMNQELISTSGDSHPSFLSFFCISLLSLPSKLVFLGM